MSFLTYKPGSDPFPREAQCLHAFASIYLVAILLAFEARGVAFASARIF